MKIHIIEKNDISNDEILIVHSPRNKQYIKKISVFIFNMLNTIDVNDSYRNFYQIPILSILYIESVDNLRFIYCKNEVYQTKHSFKFLKKMLINSGLIQINAHTLVNIHYIHHFKIDEECRRRITLSNGEELIVNRSYVKYFEISVKKIKSLFK